MTFISSFMPNNLILSLSIRVTDCRLNYLTIFCTPTPELTLMCIWFFNFVHTQIQIRKIFDMVVLFSHLEEEEKKSTCLKNNFSFHL